MNWEALYISANPHAFGTALYFAYAHGEAAARIGVPYNPAAFAETPGCFEAPSYALYEALQEAYTAGYESVLDGQRAHALNHCRVNIACTRRERTQTSGPRRATAAAAAKRTR